jgi:hypothetical protein
MKYLSPFFTLLFFMNTLYGQPPCTDQAIMDVKGSWKKREDANMKAGNNQLQIFNRMDMISKLFQSAYSQPQGMEAAWYRTMDADPLITNGPIPYNFNSFYKGWYCNQNLHKLMLADETGTWAYACVNNLGWLLRNQYDLLTIKVNNDAVYMLPPQKGTWKGYATYESSVNGAKSRCLILTHNHQFPWKFITEEQYLNAVKTVWEDQKVKSANSYNKQEENLKKGITEIQNNKYLKAADKEKIITAQQKSLDDLQKNKAVQMAQSDKLWNDKIGLIDHYISQNPSRLPQPAILDHGLMNNFSGNFSTIEKGGRLLITIDTGYFNTRLPRYVPQLIVLYWEWDNNMPALNFKKQMEDQFPIEQLKAMIDN